MRIIMNNYLAMDALTFIVEQENVLLKRMKKYFTENKELIVTRLIMMSGDYCTYHAYSKMLRKIETKHLIAA